MAEANVKDYSTKIRATDTASHPRNYKLTVSDSQSADTVLKSNETSAYLTQGRGNSGILSYHFNQVASNSPIEDDHVETHLSQGGIEWSFFGVFDGHSGWTTSSKLRQALVPYVADSLSKVTEQAPIAEAAALQSAFLSLDRDIVYNSAEQALASRTLTKAQAVAQLLPAMSGSCALLAAYNATTKMIHVAVTGDSRAIYTRKTSEGWAVKALSEDQTGSTASEVARLRSEHPNESNVVKNGRILGGLEPSRAFGDARYKWSSQVQAQIAERFYGRRAPAALLSPPYVTARPEVTSTSIDLNDQGFMVLGTDGLYEMLTNEEITELVLIWRQKYDSAFEQRSSWLPAFLGGKGAGNDKIFNEDEQRSGQKTPYTQSKKQFVCQDENVATHIIRNALGGGDTNRLYGLLSLPYPMSRSYRDDISVTVVFFGEDGKRRPQTQEPRARL